MDTARYLSVPAVALPLALSEARSALGLEPDNLSLDGQIAVWLSGIAGEMEGLTGQCLLAQTWTLTLPAYLPEVLLPHPVLSLSVSYFDEQGQRQLLPDDAYYLCRSLLKTVLYPVGFWPGTAQRRDAVRMTVRAGFGDGPENLPAAMRMFAMARLKQHEAGVEIDPKRDFLVRMLDQFDTYN